MRLKLPAKLNREGNQHKLIAVMKLRKNKYFYICSDQLVVLFFLANFHVNVGQNDIRFIDIRSANESENRLSFPRSFIIHVLITMTFIYLK